MPSITYEQLLGMLRRDLDDPDEHNPGSDVILARSREVVQHLSNLQAQAGLGHQGSSWDLQVVPGQTRYILEANQRIGRIVSPVWTIDPANPGHVSRPVEVLDQRDRALALYGQMHGYGNHSARAFFLTRGEDGRNLYLEVEPVPQVAVRYRVYYEQGQIADNGFAEIVPVSDVWHEHARNLIALALLPHCRWVECAHEDKLMQMKLTQMKRDNLRSHMEPRAVKGQMDFERWVAGNKIRGPVRSIGYAEDYARAE